MQQEKWQSFDSRLGRLRFKVVLAALFAFCFLLSVSWVAYHSFQDMLASVETLSTARPETGIVNSMIADISEIQAYSGHFTINKDSASLKSYREKTSHVRILIDSLKNEKGSQEYEDKLDTLRIVFDQYVESLDEYAALRLSTTDASDQKIYGLLKSGDSSLKHTSSFLPKAEVKRITETIEKPVVTEPAVSGEKSNKLKSNRLKKNNKKEATATVDSVSRETITKITTQVDSSYLFKVDTLLNQMKSTLSKAQIQKSGFQKKIGQRETELLGRELALMKRIRTLLDDIEQEEIALTKSSLELSKASAQDSYKKLTILATIAICVMVFLVITLFSDISKSLFYRKKLQEAKQEAERLALAKEEFLANMSHEIRTPLNSIIGFTEQLQEGDIQPGKKAKVHAILRSSNHLLSLVNDILDFSKLEAGSLKLERIGFCYTDVVEEVFEMVEPEAKKKNIQLVFEPNEASDTMVTGDPVRIKQILLNLMSNAVKFTTKGAISVNIEKKPVKKAICIACHVRDSGKGIHKTELDKIFEKFEQADNSVTRHHGGTGLGLSISKKLTELQNGEIRVESELGIGSTFTFEIPFGPAAHNEYKMSMSNVEYVPGLLKGKKILVVDDDPMVPELLSPLFQEEKIFSVFIQDPEHALEVVQRQRFDAIFVDLHMPKINGMDFIKHVKSHKQSVNKNAQVILCTANVVKNVESKIPDYVLYKPYKRKDIIHVLYRVFNINETVRPEKMTVDKNSGPMSQEFTLKNFREFAGNDLNLLDNFITLFISESEAELEKLDRHLQEKNYKQIGEIAHMFKNTYGQLEAKQELLIINKLEGLVKENHNSDDELRHLISSLQQKSRQLFQDLRKEMDGLKDDKL